MKINDVSSAISVFDAELYGDPALKFNSNACRRYLKYVFMHRLNKKKYLEHRYRDHFLIVCDSSSE